MKTILQIEIEHAKPLPSKQEITDVAADRIYCYLFANGCEAGVTAKRMTVESQDHSAKYLEKSHA